MRLNIKEKKLGRQQRWGQIIENADIEIDPRQDARMYLDTLIHELLHLTLPDLSEKTVRKSARILTSGIWQQNYRRIYR